VRKRGSGAKRLWAALKIKETRGRGFEFTNSVRTKRENIRASREVVRTAGVAQGVRTTHSSRSKEKKSQKHRKPGQRRSIRIVRQQEGKGNPGISCVTNNRDEKGNKKKKQKRTKNCPILTSWGVRMCTRTRKTRISITTTRVKGKTEIMTEARVHNPEGKKRNSDAKVRPDQSIKRDNAPEQKKHCAM